MKKGPGAGDRGPGKENAKAFWIIKLRKNVR